MNTVLLSLMDKRVEGAMIRFSQLLSKSSLLSSAYHEKLVELIQKILDTYISFFHSLNIAPAQYRYLKNPIIKKVYLLEGSNDRLDELGEILFKLFSVPLAVPVIPVNVHLYKSGQLFLYTGIGISENRDTSITFFLYKLSIPTTLIGYVPIYLSYLDNILVDYSPEKFNSLRKLVSSYGKNYNQFQKDCKEYFGDTFHQFHNKIKMIGVLEDIMLTSYSLKEIAYRNNFYNYNSMYFLFNKKHKFSIDSIPRLLNEI